MNYAKKQSRFDVHPINWIKYPKIWGVSLVLCQILWENKFPLKVSHHDDLFFVTIHQNDALLELGKASKTERSAFEGFNLVVPVLHTSVEVGRVQRYGIPAFFETRNLSFFTKDSSKLSSFSSSIPSNNFWSSHFLKVAIAV